MNYLGRLKFSSCLDDFDLHHTFGVFSKPGVITLANINDVSVLIIGIFAHTTLRNHVISNHYIIIYTISWKGNMCFKINGFKSLLR